MKREAEELEKSYYQCQTNLRTLKSAASPDRFNIAVPKRKNPVESRDERDLRGATFSPTLNRKSARIVEKKR